ncbi:MAG: DUF481 domain-containing protein, partial [Campylobacterota bacterium]|nr:DUF481 domain-containing protein [Campylobacterota bacterium]
MNKIVVLSVAAVLMLSAADKVDKNTLKTHTELSYVQTQGNTNTNSFSLDFAGSKAWDKHQFKLDFDALYGDDKGLETKNKVLGELNYDYKFAEHFAFNYLMGYKNDKFSGYEYQFYTGPGIKYIVANTKVHKLDFQANALYNLDESMDQYHDADGNEITYPYPDGTAGSLKTSGESNDYTGFSAKANYAWQIMDNLKFLQEASYRSDFDDTDNYF